MKATSFLILGFLLLKGVAFAAPLESCRQITLRMGSKLDYCLKDFGQNPHPQDIVYFWHGVGGGAENVFTVLKPQSDLYDVISSQGLSRAPLFVGLSFGSQAVVPVEVSAAKPASLDEIVSEIFPMMEKSFGYDLTAQPLTRHMMGVSMGGFNSLNFVALKPGVFHSLMALCPAVLNFDPFSRLQFNAYLERHKGIIKRTKAEYMIAMLKNKFHNFATWTKRDPLQHLAGGRYQNTPVFLSTGLQDEYGFMEGADAFAKASAGKVAAGSVFAPIDGDHCVFNPGALTLFAQEHFQGWKP